MEHGRISGRRRNPPHPPVWQPVDHPSQLPGKRRPFSAPSSYAQSLSVDIQGYPAIPRKRASNTLIRRRRVPREREREREIPISDGVIPSMGLPTWTFSVLGPLLDGPCDTEKPNLASSPPLRRSMADNRSTRRLLRHHFQPFATRRPRDRRVLWDTLDAEQAPRPTCT